MWKYSHLKASFVRMMPIKMKLYPVTTTKVILMTMTVLMTNQDDNDVSKAMWAM